MPLAEWRRILASGMLASLAYLAVMWVDERVFREPTDDLLLLGGLFTRRPGLARLIGLGLHLFNGAVVAAAYSVFARPRLRGAAWARGLVFAVSENTLLWPLILVLEAFHPDFRTGRLPSYNRGVPWLQGVFRHVAFGTAMGALLGAPDDSARPAATATSASAS